jgi:dihydrodipicolinate synthase/N-acetylneuraminate lyase
LSSPHGRADVTAQPELGFRDENPMLTLMPTVPGSSGGTAAYTPFAAPVAPELGRAFLAACRHDDAQSAAALRLAAVAMVERLKVNGLPPERVVIAMKQALMRYGGCHSPPSFHHEEENLIDGRCDATYRRLFSWCLDAYFGTA